MAKIIVSGLINIETTVQIEAFPVDYSPVRYPFFGIISSVSGVGFNVAKALNILGNEIALLSLIGQDIQSQLILDDLNTNGLSTQWIRKLLLETPQSVILYDRDGRRQINVDLKNVQEQVYPAEVFLNVLEEYDLAVLCNVNFSRPLLKLAREAGKPVATDVHSIDDLESPYDRDFMAAADILFMSDEKLPIPAIEWSQRVMDRYRAEIVVIGLGGDGAVLAIRQDRFIKHFPAVDTRPVVNTIGAGDALFASFLHFYVKSKNPYDSLEKAMFFASYKVGENGAASGFLSESDMIKVFENFKQ